MLSRIKLTPNHVANTCLLAMLCSFSVLANGAIYKHVDKNGRVTYSDQPMKNAEEVDVGKIMTISIPTPTTTSDAKPEESAPFKYQSLQITAPEMDANFINNQGQVTISGNLSPILQRQHSTQLVLNGQPQGEPGKALNFALSNVSRGSYTAAIQVLNAQGKVLISSQPVTFHVKRAIAR